MTFPYFSIPGLLAGDDQESALGTVTDRIWIRGASPSHDFNYLLASLGRELNVHELEPGSDLDVAAFCRLLAKVAIGYVAALHGVSQVPPALTSMVIDNKLEGCRHFIGSSESDEPAVNRLHDIATATFRPVNVPVVRIRFLAKLGTPTYWVALGKDRHLPSAAATLTKSGPERA